MPPTPRTSHPPDASLRPPSASPEGGAPKPSRKDLAYRTIKQKILTNGYPPGTVIDDRVEAQALGTSRTPVREALLLLQMEGLVTMEPRRGVRVVPITRRDMREIYEVLTALETMAVSLIAARRPTREELRPLVDACDAMRRAIADGDLDLWSEADERFHQGLLTLSGNTHLAETGVRFRERVRRGHFVALRISREGRMEDSLASHARLVETILAGDPADAAAAHDQQRRSSGSELLESLERSRIEQL